MSLRTHGLLHLHVLLIKHIVTVAKKKQKKRRVIKIPMPIDHSSTSRRGHGGRTCDHWRYLPRNYRRRRYCYGHWAFHDLGFHGVLDYCNNPRRYHGRVVTIKFQQRLISQFHRVWKWNSPFPFGCEPAEFFVFGYTFHRVAPHAGVPLLLIHGAEL